MKTRSTYSNEFNIDTAILMLKQGYSIQEAADAMNAGPAAVRRQPKEYEVETQGITTKARL